MPDSRSLPLPAWIAAHAGRAFAAFLGLHVAVWTALPTLLYPNLPLDLIEAMSEGQTAKHSFSPRMAWFSFSPFIA